MKASRSTQLKGLLVLFFAMSWGGWHKFISSENDTQSARFVSLGTPLAAPKKSDQEQSVLLNDPSVSRNWGLMGTGGASDIRVNRAWQITQGSRDIRVAIIDTGIDANHPDLKTNLWTNAGETGFDAKGKDKSSNGIDDDSNGYIDDVHGWNFVDNTGSLTDNHGHGTHVAGIVGAEGGNGIGISGVAPKVSIMVLKYYDPKSNGTDNLKNTIRAFKYAVQMKAHIINYSGGGLDYSAEEYKAVKEARDAGILFVSAAGNEYSNSDQHHYYPANYPLDNIISVTAINPSAEVLKSSNYGVRTVDIAAPGEGIFSTLPGNRYGYMTGTSQATAFVTGVAALLFANNKDFDYKRVKDQILKTADEIPSMRDKNKMSGKLNSWAALAMQSALPLTGAPVSAPSAPVFANADGVEVKRSGSSPASQLKSISEVLKAVTRTPAERNN